jgi:hypothetical protein
MLIWSMNVKFYPTIAMTSQNVKTQKIQTTKQLHNCKTLYTLIIAAPPWYISYKNISSGTREHEVCRQTSFQDIRT